MGARHMSSTTSAGTMIDLQDITFVVPRSMVASKSVAMSTEQLLGARNKLKNLVEEFSANQFRI